MKKYLNKYTITVLVVLAIIIGIQINIYTDRAYLTECLNNESLEMYIINETTGETLTDNEINQQHTLLTSEEKRKIMEYLRDFEFGNADNKGQSNNSRNRWYGILLSSEAQGMIYFAIYNYERNDYVECQKCTDQSRTLGIFRQFV